MSSSAEEQVVRSLDFGGERVESTAGQPTPAANVREDGQRTPPTKATPDGQATPATQARPPMTPNSPAPIRVMLRVRPFTAEEMGELQTKGSAAPEDAERRDPLLDARISSITALDDTSITLRATQAPLYATVERETSAATFTFERVYASVSQRALFRYTTWPLLRRLFVGRSALVFAYGATGAGKTYTVHGTRREPGLARQALQCILEAVGAAPGSHGLHPLNDEDRRLLDDKLALSKLLRHTETVDGSSAPDIGATMVAASDVTDLFGASPVHSAKLPVTFSVALSATEVYNEQVFDLLTAPPADQMRPLAKGTAASRPVRVRCPLRLREQGRHGTQVEVTPTPIASVADAEALFRLASANRTVGPTLHNRVSSRSHGMVTIHLCRYERRRPDATADAGEKVDASGCVRVWQSQLTLVDLAGAERIPPDMPPARVREAAQINSSLMHLGHCLQVLRRNQRGRGRKTEASGGGVAFRPELVPFRQSRLTRLFQTCLESGAAVMIACISPHRTDANESIHALRCAAVAGQVRLERRARRPLAELQVATACTPAAAPRSATQRRERTGATAETVKKALAPPPPKRQRETDVSEVLESCIRAECAAEMEQALQRIREEYEARIAAMETEMESLNEQRIGILTDTARKNAHEMRSALADAHATIETLLEEKALCEERIGVLTDTARKHTDERQSALADAHATIEKLQQENRRLHERNQELVREVALLGERLAHRESGGGRAVPMAVAMMMQMQAMPAPSAPPYEDNSALESGRPSQETGEASRPTQRNRKRRAAPANVREGERQERRPPPIPPHSASDDTAHPTHRQPEAQTHSRSIHKRRSRRLAAQPSQSK
ncbi:hypothetical protein CDCA_CDCA13G3656 [Cyanidium caldarium]|uniref:Kinesin-like protein n=1 Tax=Cyanidium caldarium TaxID=2771 RepID=A0AAV9IZR8_CYACA|nr:hypothetical protein CDCA_CDCA13G3656 [Cyanidium caldarium]